MQQLTSIATRPAFVEANPTATAAAAHRNAQRAMFGAAREARLSTDRDDQLEGINAALGLRGGNRLVSRRQMSVEEMQAITVAIEAGFFSYDWTWGNDFSLSITRRQVTEVHFTPRVLVHPVTGNDRAAFSRLLNS